MPASIKSEFRKLLSVRSTYVIIIIATLFITFMSFYIEGFRGIGDSTGEFALRNLTNNVTNFAGTMSAIVAILFVVHEYRYNLITYTLTASNNRTKVLISKFITVTVFCVLFALYCAALGVGMYLLGAQFAGHEIIPQNYPVAEVLAKSTFFVFGYAMLGTVLAFLTRNLAASIVLLLFGLGAIEGLLGLLLKENVKYLPLNALQQVASGNPMAENARLLSPGRAALIYGIYLLIAWAVTWFLFVRRDAN